MPGALNHQRELPHPPLVQPLDPQPVGGEQLVIGAARYVFLAGERLLPWMREPIPPCRAAGARSSRRRRSSC